LTPSSKHRCGWRDRAEALETELTSTRSELEALRQKTSHLDERIDDLNHRLFGKRSERQRIPSITAEIKKLNPSSNAEKQSKRKATLERKKQLESIPERPAVPTDQCHCEFCGDGPEQFQLVGSKASTVYSMQPARLIKKVITRDTLACGCGRTMVSAPPPRRFGKTQYDASVAATLITGKCEDSIPVARQAQQLTRQGAPANRATLNRIFLSGGEMLLPIAHCILQRVASSDLVLADETPMRQQNQTSKGYFWVFSNEQLSAYVYSPNRSGDTPKRVLGDSQGDLVVDGFTGYNHVTTPGKRRRSGCSAHARRKFCEAKPKTPEAQFAIDQYTEIFLVEFEAKRQGITGTKAHLKLRQERSAPAVARLYKWLEEQEPQHLPKGKMGEAITYALNNRDALTRFLTDAKIPISNNRSERQLRGVALGRKNYMSVGHVEAGEKIAALYTIVACCKAAGVNTTAYLTDTLERLAEHSDIPIESLLPSNWKPPG